MDDLNELVELADDFYRHCRAKGLKHSTIGQYRDSINLLIEWLEENAYPTRAVDINHKYLTRYFANLADRPSKRRPGQRISTAYVSLQYRNLQQFWKWLVEVEQEVDTNPFDRLQRPKVTAGPVPVFTEDELRRLVQACNGTDFSARRDMAIMRILIDTGVRVSELVGIKLDDIDFETGSVRVTGKGDRIRVVPLGQKTVEAIRRYLRARKHHPWARKPEVFLGTQGPLTTWGVRMILRHRSAIAKVDGVHPHRFRHTFAHRWRLHGGSTDDLMMIAGWSSSTMPLVYGRSAAAERARQAHRRAGLGDTI